MVSRKQNLLYALREAAKVKGEVLVNVKVTYVGDEESHIEIGKENVTVDTEQLLTAYGKAEAFVDENIDGG